MTYGSQTTPAPDAETVNAALRRVTSSPTLSGSERLVRFLDFVVAETLAGRADTLKETRIGLEVFGRPADYDPKLDPIVRVQARRLRAKLDEFYAAEPSERVRIELLKGSYIPQFHFAPEPQLPQVEPEPAPAPVPARAVLSRRYWWAALALVLAVVGVLASLVIRRSAASDAPLGPSRPLTNYSGYQTSPAFSPDGQTVAFAWEGPEGGKRHIYTQRVDADSPRRLTSSPLSEDRPVFSPNGDRIALVREVSPGQFAIIDVPVTGSGEHHLSNLRGDSSSPPRIDWSSDSRFIYATEPSGPGSPAHIVRISLSTGERTTLTNPPAGTPGDAEVAVSPDGRQVAFRRSREVAVEDVFVMPVSGGTPQPVTHDGVGIIGFAWMPGNREIIVSSRRGSSLQRLWRFSIHGGSPRLLTDAALAASWPSVSLRTGRLAYSSRFFDANVWRVDLTGTSTPQRWIASNVLDSGAQYSKDGHSIAFRSNRTGSDEVWLTDAEGHSPRRLTRFEGPVSGSAQWSPDGRLVALDSRPFGNADIFLVETSGSSPRRFTDAPSNEVLPRFSRDGASVYFASDRSGTWQIWNQPLNSAPASAPRQVTQNGGFAGYESEDGRWLYYSKGGDTPGLWRMPTAGGPESIVFPDLPGMLWGNWAIANETLFYMTTSQKLESVDLKTGTKRSIATLPFPPARRDTGLGVSSDGRWALVTQVERAGSIIQVVEP